MTYRLFLAVILPAALASCGKNSPSQKVGGIQISFQADCRWLEENGRKEMESALARFPKIDLVYGHNDPVAHGARLAANRAGRADIKFVGIDALPHEGIKYVRQGLLDATFSYPTCGADAIDLVLLVLSGVKLPKRISLGSKMFTRANVDKGGLALDAPGARVLADLRAKNKEAFAAKLTLRQYRVGMSQCNLGEPWRVQMNADLRAAAAKYPWIELVEKDAQNNTDTQRNQIDEFIADKVDCLLVSPLETIPLTKPVARAFKAGIPVIVIDRAVAGDDFTCFIGGDNVMIGKAVGRWVHKTLNGKGNVVELQGLMTSQPARDRHEGFLTGLREAAK